MARALLLLEFAKDVLWNALRWLRLRWRFVDDGVLGLLLQDLEHILVLEFMDIVGGHFFWNGDLLGASKLKACERHRHLGHRAWCFWLLVRTYTDVIELVEVFELKEKAIMDVALGTVDEDLVAALALDELALRPELREKLHDDVDDALVAQDRIFTPYLEPFFGPPGVGVAHLAAQFDTTLDLRDELVRDVLEGDSCLDVVSDVGRDVLRGDRAVVARLFNMDYVILFPFLEVIVVVLVVLLALDVLSRQRRATGDAFHVGNGSLRLLVEYLVHAVQLLAHLIQERHALLRDVLLHRWLLVQPRRFREIQDSDQALSDLHRTLELCHLWVSGVLWLRRGLRSGRGQGPLRAPQCSTLVQDPVLVVSGRVLSSTVVNDHVAEHDVVLERWLL